MIRVNDSVCDECGTCVSVCPTAALSLDTRVRVDERRCTSCGRCVKVCAFGALELNTGEPKNESR